MDKVIVLLLRRQEDFFGKGTYPHSGSQDSPWVGRSSNPLERQDAGEG